MKNILFLLFIFSSVCLADLCDDLHAKDKSFWEKKDNLTLCQDALNGDADSQFDLARWYMAEEKNPSETFNWVRESAAQGCAKSQYVAGLMYYNGEGTETNWLYASELIGRAAKSGLPPAKSMLGFMYLHGHAVEQNKDKARALFEEAAELNDPEAFYYLGKMYQEGDGVTIDNDKTAYYFAQKLLAIVKTAIEHNNYLCDVYNDLN